MTDPRRLSHEAAEELISASLTNDLTDAERGSLDAHLAGCARCRATAAAFAESRRMLSGIRHVGAPRDLGARVRSGIERGRFSPLPWWRRPAFAVAGTATLAAAAVALAVIIGRPFAPPPVASGSSSASPTASGSSAPSAPASSPSAAATPEPSLPAVPPVYRVEYAFDVPGDINQGISLRIVDQASGATVRTLNAGEQLLGGLPMAAVLSPDGSWLALRVLQDGKGTELLYAIEVHGTAVVPLGESLPSPFQAMSWSPKDGRYLAYTLIDLASRAADVRIFEPATGAIRQLTRTGHAFAGGWACCVSGSSNLWVSVASGARPTSYLINLQEGASPPTNLDPAQAARSTADAAFLPIVSPDGRHVMFWRGALHQTGLGWEFAAGGSLAMASTAGDGSGSFDPATGGALFTTFDATLVEARVAWAPDSDAYAVWGATTSDGSPFPAPGRVYFGHLSRPQPLLTADQALDESDIPADGIVRDVALAPDGRHLAITIGFPIPGDLAQPVAELRLVTRYFDQRADEVQGLGPSDIWVGPGVYAP